MLTNFIEVEAEALASVVLETVVRDSVEVRSPKLNSVVESLVSEIEVVVASVDANESAEGCSAVP